MFGDKKQNSSTVNEGNEDRVWIVISKLFIDHWSVCCWVADLLVRLAGLNAFIRKHLDTHSQQCY